MWLCSVCFNIIINSIMKKLAVPGQESRVSILASSIFKPHDY